MNGYELPSRGWGPWRQEFYSFHSSPRLQKEDVKHEFGGWHNVWVHKLDSGVYRMFPKFWVWYQNHPLLRWYTHRDLRRCFPNLMKGTRG